MGALNKDQVVELFHREAIMIDDRDVVPKFRINRLFGQEATEFADRLSNHRYSSCYGVGDYMLHYMTYPGFLIAASYYNVQQVRGDDHEQSASL